MRIKSERKRKIPKFKIIIFVGILVFIGILLGTYNFFTVKEVNLIFTNEPCEIQEIIESKIKLRGKNIIFLNLNSIESEIKNNFKCIKKSKISKSLPSKIEITLESRTALLNINHYKLATSSGLISLKDVNISSQSSNLNIPDYNIKFNKSFLIDETGFVISTESAKKITFKANFIGDEPKVFSPMEIYMNTGIKILEELKKVSIPLDKVLIVQDKFLVIYGKPDLIFSFKKDPKEQVTSLQLILQQAKMNSNSSNPNSKDSKDIIKIDLRYDKPVITFSR